MNKVRILRDIFYLYRLTWWLISEYAPPILPIRYDLLYIILYLLIQVNNAPFTREEVVVDRSLQRVHRWNEWRREDNRKY